jgi:hypothetical protein
VRVQSVAPLVIVTVEPAMEQPPVAVIDVVRLAVAVASAENVEPKVRGVVGCANVIAWSALTTVTVSAFDVSVAVVAVMRGAPMALPVTVRVATPLMAVTAPRPVTAPTPLVYVKVTVEVE